MVGWHHQFNGHDFEQAPGDGEGQGSLVCFNLWGHKESDMTEQLNNQDAVHSRRYLQDNGFYFFNSSPSLFYKRTWHPDLDKSAIFCQLPFEIKLYSLPSHLISELIGLSVQRAHGAWTL